MLRASVTGLEVLMSVAVFSSEILFCPLFWLITEENMIVIEFYFLCSLSLSTSWNSRVFGDEIFFVCAFFMSPRGRAFWDLSLLNFNWDCVTVIVWTQKSIIRRVNSIEVFW